MSPFAFSARAAAKAAYTCGASIVCRITGKCFTAGTPVSTETGLRAIETIRPGDRVWAFNHRENEWHLKSVLQNFEREYKADLVHVTVNGETIQSTMLHPFWVISGKDLSERPMRSHLEKPPNDSTIAGRWVDATDLKVGDRLLLIGGTDAVVEQVEHIPADTTVYNFSVDELRCYAVGKLCVLVHNTCGSEALSGIAANSGPIHHIATNKNSISNLRGGPWTPRFDPIFKKAGITLEDAANKIRVPGHAGPHPEAYHQEVFDRLRGATNGLSGADYKSALLKELDVIAGEATTVGSRLNKLITGG